MQATAADSARSFDLVIWGATGYTGRLVAIEAANHLADRRWAIAGRSRERLENVRAEIATMGGTAPDIVVASLDEIESLRRMTGSARVVLTTVGPYDLVGEPLVAACIATGTHLADITGEVPWVRRMRATYEDAARAAGVRIVSMCGYDSIPSELGVRLLQDVAIREHGRPATEVEMAVGPIRGGISGGTIASALNMLAKAGDPEIRAGLRGAGALCVSPPSNVRGLSGEQWGVRRSRGLREWTGPFFMAGVNVAVVQRTHELLGLPWGEHFHYRESAAGGRGLGGLLHATMLSAGTIVMAMVLVIPPLRWIARRWFLPSPGEGPDAARLRDGFVRHRTVSVDPPVLVEVEVDVDPGYAATARMLLASGMAMLDGDVDESISDAFCTPGAIFGRRLVPRLESMGFRFAVHTDPATTG